MSGKGVRSEEAGSEKEGRKEGMRERKKGGNNVVTGKRKGNKTTEGEVENRKKNTGKLAGEKIMGRRRKGGKMRDPSKKVLRIPTVTPGLRRQALAQNPGCGPFCKSICSSIWPCLPRPALSLRSTRQPGGGELTPPELILHAALPRPSDRA